MLSRNELRRICKRFLGAPSLVGRFRLWIFLGASCLLLFLFLRNYATCKQDPQNVWTIEGKEYSKQTRSRAKQLQYSATIKKQETNTEKEEAEAKNTYDGIVSSVACGEGKLADSLLVFFTYCLVIVGWFAVRSGDETQRRSERAYMFVEVLLEENLLPTHEGTALSNIRVKFWNHGRTPAEIIRIRGYGKVCKRMQHQLDAAAEDTPLPPGLAIAEKNAFPIDAQVRLTHADKAAIEGVTTILYCVGRIDYRDVFGEEHETGFCWQYRPKKNDFIISRDSRLNRRT